MKMHSVIYRLGLCFTAVAFLPSLLAAGSTFTRSERGEFHIIVQNWTAEDSTIPNLTLPVGIGPGAPTATSNLTYKFDDTVFWGLGGGYNIDDSFMVRCEFMFGTPKFKMAWNNGTLTGESWINTGKVNVDWNILKKKAFSPFVSAGIGYLYIDTGIPSGPPEYYLWWDYWWGYTGTVVQPTFYKTYFTYNGCVGFRWDFHEGVALRLSYGANWFNTSKVGTLQTTELNLSVAFKY